MAYDEGAGRGRPLDDEGLNPAGSAEGNFVELELELAPAVEVDPALTLAPEVEPDALGADWDWDCAWACLLNSAKLLAVTDSVMLLHVHSPSHTGHMSSSSSALSYIVCARAGATV